MGTMLETNGFNGEMKFEMFMMGRNSILVRVENIADIFKIFFFIIIVQSFEALYYILSKETQFPN